MAVTRRMAKQKVINANKKNKMKPTINFRQCTVKLDRLSQKEIEEMAILSIEKIPLKSPVKRKHNLRNKPTPSIVPTETKKRAKNVVARNTQCPSKLWNNLKSSRRNIVPAINSIVLAKMKTYSPWPSKLVGVRKSNALVYFFGTNNHGEVKLDEIVEFAEAPQLIKVLCSKKIKDYRKAVREAEIFMNVPSEKSILNEVYAMNPCMLL